MQASRLKTASNYLPRSLVHFAALCAAISGIATAERAEAQDYPARRIEMVVPYPPGGTAGIMGHLLAPKLTELLGQPVVIDQRPGAATRTGTTYVAKAKPDGYTLLLVSDAPFTLLPNSGPPLPFDPQKDFAAVSMLSRSSPMLLVTPSFPAKTVAEFIEMLKKEPDKYAYASSGIGGTNHIAGELFQKQAGVKMKHVPFTGTGAGIPSLLGGHVQVMFGYMNSVAPYIRDKSIKALATGSAQRVPSMADIPTMAESGLPGYEFTSWFGVFAPAGTPPAIVKKLNEALVIALKDPTITEKLTADGSELVGSTPEFLQEKIKSDGDRYASMKYLFEQKPEETPAPAKQ